MWSAVKKYWWVVLLAIPVVPYLAFQQMKERKAREAEAHQAEDAGTAYPLDDRVKGLTLVMHQDAGVVGYLNGDSHWADGIGIAVLTWEDQRGAPDRLKKIYAGPKEEDFPVVVFFNLSGFDSTGEPGVIRRAKDGSVVAQAKDRPPGRLTQAVAGRDGTWTGYVLRGKAGFTIRPDDFYRLYVGVEPPARQPSPEELDKMSEDQLKKLGVRKMTRAEYVKQAKTGIRGEVVRLAGSDKAVEPVECDVYAFRGKVEPGKKLSLALNNLVADTAKSDKDGKFELAVPPGVYTLAVYADGEMRSNSLRPGRWPTVTVKDKWVDYNFRMMP
jgi:hypothetical protein